MQTFCDKAVRQGALCEAMHHSSDSLFFCRKNNARKISLRKQLNTLSKAPSEPITKYVARAKTIWSDLVATGTQMPESEVALLILTGLPKEYEVVATVLEVQAEELGIDEIVPHLLPVEQRMNRDQDIKTIYAVRDGRKQQARQQSSSTAPSGVLHLT